jgi:hypothetical protein
LAREREAERDFVVDRRERLELTGSSAFLPLK